MTAPGVNCCRPSVGHRCRDLGILANFDFKPGLTTTQWLSLIGITNIRAVARMGVVDACVLLRRAGHPVCLNLAYGLQADLMGTTWNRLPEAVRDELRVAYRNRLG